MKHIKLFESFKVDDMEVLSAMEFFDAVHDPNDEDRKPDFEEDENSYVIVAWDISSNTASALKRLQPEIEKAESLFEDPETEVEEMAYNGNMCVYVFGKLKNDIKK